MPKTKLALARALWDSRADRQRARSLALESKSQLMSSSRTQTPEFREASDWLERH